MVGRHVAPGFGDLAEGFKEAGVALLHGAELVHIFPAGTPWW